MASGHKIRLQLLQAVLAATCQSPRGPQPTDHTKEGKGGQTEKPKYHDLYGASVAVLAKNLKQEFPSPMQVWYADDFSATASGKSIRPLMKRLGYIRLLQWVFPDPAK